MLCPDGWQHPVARGEYRLDLTGEQKAQELSGEFGLRGMREPRCNFDLLIMTLFKHRDSVPIGVFNVPMIGR